MRSGRSGRRGSGDAGTDADEAVIGRAYATRSGPESAVCTKAVRRVAGSGRPEQAPTPARPQWATTTVTTVLATTCGETSPSRTPSAWESRPDPRTIVSNPDRKSKRLNS